MTLRGRIRTRLGDESGFSLTELLMTLSVGMIVLFATLSLLDSSQTVSARVTDRTEAVQRGRTAMEQITQRLRAQICLDTTTPSIFEASPTGITFFVDLSNASATYTPQKRRIEYAGGAITEYIYPSTTATTPSSTRVIITNVTLAAGKSFLTYFPFTTAGAVSTVPIIATPSMAAADRQRAVKITVNFTARSLRGPAQTVGQTEFENSVFARTASPSDPASGAQCL